MPKQSLPVRGAWIEIEREGRSNGPSASLPVRGAWIEILEKAELADDGTVAPRKGSVD